MAKSRIQRSHDREDPPEPVQDPSLADMDGGGLATLLTDEHEGPVEPSGPQTILRPSQLVELMQAEGYCGDPYRYLRDKGLPNPVKLYRVTGKGPVGNVAATLDSSEIDATDETEAVRLYAIARNVPTKELHRFKFFVVELEA